MTKKNSNPLPTYQKPPAPPAPPARRVVTENGGCVICPTLGNNMTRTEIATQVLAGLVANPHVVEDAMQSPEWVKDLVDTSLEFADAILKAERRMP